MVLRTKAAGKQSARRGFQQRIHAPDAVCCLTLLAAALLLPGASAAAAHGEQPGASISGPPALAALAGTAQSLIEPALPPAPPAAQPSADWIGKPVKRIRFEGVSAGRLGPLAGQLAQIEGSPLTAAYLENSLRRLYATGLYDTLAIEGVREANGVDLIFGGRPRTFIGIVSVYGAKGATVNTQLESVSQLRPGTRFTTEKLQRAIAQMRDVLSEDGYHTPTIEPKLTPHPAEQLVDIAFHVNSGQQARVGEVQVTGDAGMSVSQFRHYAHLHAGSRVTHDTVDRALSGVLKHYQKQERFEAEVRLESEQYVPGAKRVNFSFDASRGPVVHVKVEGASIEEDDMKRLVPIFQEGAVDEDLLNEGNRRLRDFYQRQGYFDVKVNHTEHSADSRQVTILFTVNLGPRRRVERVSVTGNHYFDAGTLEDLLSVHAANVLDRHGAYSQALVAADEAALQGVYHNNGFPKVKVTAQTSTPQTDSKQSRRARAKTAPLIVTYHIDEGKQQRVGAVRIEGNRHIDTAMLTPLMNTISGQLFSLRNLAGDRNALLTEYLSRGFEHAAVDVTEDTEKANPDKVDVEFRITEGAQTFVRNVLLTGLHFTRPDTVAHAITIHPGQPLNQSALLNTQRNLYNLALFNQVNTAVQNPAGNEAYKTVLVQMMEARRWTLTYGFGLEAQTGQPQNNCAGATAAGVACSPNGKTGVSPRVLADITRSGLLGRDQSASLQGTYGLLEESVNLLYQIPHFEGSQNLGFTFAGGYAKSQAVTTYVASRLQGDMRWTQNFLNPGAHLSRANTFVYELNFRRVKVAASSLQVYPGAIQQLSAATRVAGPSFTWIRDTRDSAMDAHRGSYTSFQDFLSAGIFGAEAKFNRLDITYSNYYSFDKNRFVIARNTRYGQVRAFGSGSSGFLPLPERLYAGGAVSLRAFSQNAAGGRDPETGFPIGGAGVLINSIELRLPPPTLPWLGNSLSFNLFHDMGNVFDNAGDAWISALRVHQPDRTACRDAVANVNDPNSFIPHGTPDSTGVHGACNFNYFAHAAGVGLLYHTPIGPIRLDLSYTLNPPIYPVNINYSIPTTAAGPPNIPGYESAPRLGEAPHFHFFFSLGQAF